MTLKSLPLLAAAAFLASASAASAEPSTVRIVTKPYTSAIVTIEQGVRVWRALPRTTLVIMTPHAHTPVAIDVGVYGERQRHHHHYYTGPKRHH